MALATQTAVFYRELLRNNQMVD